MAGPHESVERRAPRHQLWRRGARLYMATGPRLMATSNQLRQRLGAVVTRLADEVHREGAESLATAHGVGVSSLTRHLGMLMAGATLANLATVEKDVVGFGSRVLVQDVDSEAPETYHLMASQAMDLFEDHVSLESPLGTALLGTAEGDIVDVTTPNGHRTLRVLAVRSLLDLLDVLDPHEDGLVAGARS